MVFPALKKIEGKYEVLEKLNEGGMGAVYKVRHRLLEEIRVIKVMQPHLEEDENLKQRFLREARAAVKLRHPNIAQLYDFTIDEDGTAFMVMEFIDGKNLVELRRARGYLNIGLLLDIGIQTLSALSYLHHCHFVHRDISPDNLMLTTDMRGQRLVKLIDLGIAKPLVSEVDLTRAGLFLGKIQYASPEQFGGSKGKAKIDQRSDLYSLGVVLYEALTGQHPFPGDNYQALVAGHLFRPPTEFSETDPEERIPPALRAVVLRALEKEPENRFANAEQFSEELQRIQQEWQEPEEEEPMPTVILGREQLGYVKPGTTQERLDRTFGADPTPPPVFLEEVVEAEGPDPAALAKESRERIEELMREGRLASAERELRKAEEAVGQHELLEGLQGALEDRSGRAQAMLARAKRRQQAGKLEGAREALAEARVIDAEDEEVAALLSEVDSAIEERARAAAEARRVIEGHLEKGGLDEAAKALKEAEQSFGAQEELLALRARLEEQRAAEAHAKAIARIGREVEDLIEEGRLDEATAALEVARKEHADEETFVVLAQRIVVAEAERERQRRERQQERLERQVQALLRNAVKAAGQEDFSAALEKVEAALGLAPESRELGELVERYRAALERQREERRRAAALEEVAVSISEALKKGDDGAAKQALARAEGEFGPAEILESLRARIEALRLEKRQARAAELLEEAELLMQSGELEAACGRAEQVLELSPDSPRARSLLEQVRKRQAEEERARAAARAAERIEQLLAEDRLAEADRAFAEAEGQFAGTEALERAGDLLTQKRQEIRARVERSLTEARKLLESDDLEAAAQLLREAVRLEAGAQEARKLLQKTEQEQSRRREAEERARAIAAATGEITALLEVGRVRKAARALQGSVRRLGESQEFVELRNAVDRRRREAAEASPLRKVGKLLGQRRVWLSAGGGAALLLALILALIGLSRLGPVESGGSDVPGLPDSAARVEGQEGATLPEVGVADAASGAKLAEPVQLPTVERQEPEGVEQPGGGVEESATDGRMDQGLRRAATLAEAGLASYRVGDRAAALEAALAALKLQPENRQARQLVGDLLSDGQRDTARARQAALAADAAQRAPALFSQASQKAREAQRYVQENRPEVALRLLSDSFELFRQSEGEARRFAALEAERQRAESEVREVAEKAIGGEPGSGDTAVGASPGDAPPPPQESARAGAGRQEEPSPEADETDAVRRVLAAVERAYESLDVAALQQVWPTLSGDRLAAIERSFARARSFEVDIDQCSVRFDGDAATASCRMRQSYRPKRGTRQSIDRQVTFRLRKTGGLWRLEGF